MTGTDQLSEAGIQRYLTNPTLRVRVFDRVTSTNTLLKQMAAEGEPAGLALVAGAQTAGRGRMGRSFYSPEGCGLYLSLLLRPTAEAAEVTRLTACAAVATAEAIEELTEARPGIKWVNDLYLDGKKICGILAEAGLHPETGRMSYVVVGIGVNLYQPKMDYPEELKQIAGTVLGTRKMPELRNRLTALILGKLAACADNPGALEIYQKYRERSLTLGREITIIQPGTEPVHATAIDLERDYGLRVRGKDGSERILRSGEISIRIS